MTALQLPCDLPSAPSVVPLIDAVATGFDGEVISRRLPLFDRGETFAAADPVADFLIGEGLVLAENGQGHLIVDCPWATGHTTGGTDAAWLPAGTGGVERGHFHCFHASCAARTDDEFLEALGIGPSNDFEVLPPVAPDPDGWALPIIDTTRWIDAEPPEDRWIVPGWLMRGTAALLVGEDGVGKSLLAQQLCTAVAAGRPFLGLPTVQVPSHYLTCEDGETPLWRRQRGINYGLGLPVDCAPAMLSSLVGRTDVQLGHFDRNGTFIPGKALTSIAAHAKTTGCGLIVLDNLAHFFVGNEIVRREVAAFCSALEWLAIEADAAVVLLAHPNKGGAEYSGSTGWSAHVRQRWYMDRPRIDGVASADPNARILRKSKANYSSTGDEIDFRWHEWAFRRDADLNDDETQRVVAESRATIEDAAFLACLAERNRQERPVSENKASRTYAPKEFASMAEAKGIGQGRLEHAMDRLFRLQRIARGVVCRVGRKDREGLILCADLRADPALSGCADVRRRSALTCAHTHLPPKGGIGGASEGPPPSQPDGIPDNDGDEP